MIDVEDGPVRYDFRLWATPLPTVKDWRKAYDWPVEGENFLNWIQVKATNTSENQADAKLQIVCSPKIQGDSTSSYDLDQWRQIMTIAAVSSSQYWSKSLR